MSARAQREAAGSRERDCEAGKGTRSAGGKKGDERADGDVGLRHRERERGGDGRGGERGDGGVPWPMHWTAPDVWWNLRMHDGGHSDAVN
jgi:hypothetical protein